MEVKKLNHRNKMFRMVTLLLAINLLIFSPVSDYLGAKKSYAAFEMSPVNFVFDVLFHTVGVSAQENTAEIVQDIWDWVKDGVTKAPERFLEYQKTMEFLERFAWGETAKIAEYKIIDMLLDYFKGKGGYGTEQGLNDIVINNSGRFTFADSFSAQFGGGYEAYFGAENYAFSSFGYSNSSNGATSHMDGKVDYFYNPSEHGDVKFALVESYGRFRSYYFDPDTRSLEYYQLGYIFYNIDGRFIESTTTTVVLNDIDTQDMYINRFPVPVYATQNELKAYLRDGIVGNPINNFTVDGVENKHVPVTSHPDIQLSPILYLSPDFVMPASPEAAAQLKEQYSNATTAKDMEKALSPVLEVQYGEKAEPGTEDKPDTYPWIPDILAPLSGIFDKLGTIADGLSGLKSWITDIPAKLVDIKDSITAIPGKIADFFTIDTARISEASRALESAFMAKFEPLSALADVLGNASAKLNNSIPVIRMPVPESLYSVVGGKEIIVFDLRGFETYVSWFRVIVQCVLWLDFVFGVLALFKVNFHIS